MNNRISMALAAVLALALLVGLVVVAQAQPGPFGGGPGVMGPGGPGGPGGMMAPGMVGPGMIGPGGPVMAATDQAVYVLMGPKIYKFDAGNLELLAEAELPRPELMPRPEANAEAE